MICAVCGLDAWKVGSKLCTCTECGYVRAADQYFLQNLNTIYTDSYYSQGDYFEYESEKKALKQNFCDRLLRIKKYIKTGDLLEVGTAYGYFLELAQADFKCVGVEYHTELAQKVSKELSVSVLSGPFESAFLQENTFDVIVSLDTIEHVPNPKKFIQKCHSLLRPGGYLFIETGDISAFVPRVQGEKWRLVHPPEHLSYLSSSSIKKILSDVGFNILSIDRVGFYRSINQTLYRLFPNMYKNVPNYFKMSLGKTIFSLNTFDLIFVSAQKKEN